MALVRLDGYEDHMPSQLSGGQQQRVALARALVMDPQVLLLDEPLAALDLKLRQAMQEELRRIHRDIGGTFVFVTHDKGEALALANRIAVMKDGRIEQLGTPEEIYLRPATHFIAGFIGEANLLKGELKGGRIETACGISCAPRVLTARRVDRAAGKRAPACQLVSTRRSRCRARWKRRCSSAHTSSMCSGCRAGKSCGSRSPASMAGPQSARQCGWGGTARRSA